MIPTKRNHFYTKEVVSNAVGVYPQFKDLCVGAAETTLLFKGGLGATQYVVSGNVSETPLDGSAELVGGYFQSYVTGMSVSGTSILPEMVAYKVQDNFPITEGGFTLATGVTELPTGPVTGTTTGTIGDAFWFSSAQLSSEAIWLEENFDGSNKSMGADLILPGGGSAVLTIDDAYVSPKKGAEEIWAGGDAFFGGGASNSVEHNLGKYYSVGGPSGDRERVDVRPHKKNRIKGLWTSVHDHRNEKQKWQIYEPYWKWDGIKSILEFGKKDPISENPDANKEANPENTVFNKLYKDSSIGYEQILTGNPQFSTTMTLEPSEVGGIGQALLMKSDWGLGSAGNGAWNFYNWLSKSNHSWDSVSVLAPVQGMWASIYNIPYPLPNNIGAISQTIAESGAMAQGDQRVAFPEININMMIKNLLPSPALDMTEPAVAGINVIAYGDNAGTSDVGGTSEYANTVTDIQKMNKTFWRSVVITFSNYKPEEVSATCTLDQFLQYGLDYAYGRLEETDAVDGINKFNAANDKLGPKIVTGLVFETFYTASGGASTQDGQNNEYIDSNVLYAYPLPVSRFVSGSGYNDSFGMIATTGGTNKFSPAGAMLHRPEIGVLTGSGRSGYPYVKAPMNEFFNVKFVFDVQQPWNYESSYGWYMEENAGPAYDYMDSGVPIRAYFDTVAPETRTGTGTTFSEVKDGKIPYVNLAFPAMGDVGGYKAHYMCALDASGANNYRQPNGGSSALLTDVGRGLNSYFPKHMTIWVNNIGMAPARTATPAFWAGRTTWFDSTYWVSDDYGFPVLDAAGDVADVGSWTGPNPITTDILIDTITFKYWNSSITNMSTGGGTFSKFMKAENPTVLSPAAKYTYATSDTKYTKAFGQDGSLNPLQPGQNFTIGFKDFSWLPEVGEAGTGGASTGSNSGYMLFNNFASKEFGLLQRNSPDAAWTSVYLDADLQGAGWFAAGVFGYQMYGDIAITGTIDRPQATQTAYAKIFIETGSTIDPDTSFPAVSPFPAYDDQAYMCMGYEGDGDWLSTDGLTQKGFMKFTFSSGNTYPAMGEFAGTGGNAGRLVARENVLTSAKIIAVSGAPPSDGTKEDNPPKNVIMVDNIDIFAEDLDDEYIIYRGGEFGFEYNNIANIGDDAPPLGNDGYIADPFTVASCELTSGSNSVTHPSSSLVKVGMSVSGTVSVTGDDSELATRAQRGIQTNSYVINRPGTSATAFLMNKAATYTSDGSAEKPHMTLTFNIACRSALGYKHKVKMVSKDMTNNTVELKVISGSTTLENGILKADDDWTDLCVSDNLYQLYISPKRYWINMMFSNEDWGANLQYENICMIGETPATGSISSQLGSTYNEALYTYNTGNMATKGLAAVKENPWILGVSEEQTSLIISEDFGYGSYDGEKNTGGEAAKTVPVLGTNSYFDISKMVKAISPGPSQEISLVLGLNAEVSTKEVTIVGDDDTALDISGSTFYRPQYVWEYHDALPEISQFKVQPQFELLSTDTNLYDLTKQPINNLKFTWDEDGEDIWYRHLIIDTSGSIVNKYHRASLWLPLNEYSAADWVTGGTDEGYSGPYNYYVNLSGMTSGTLNDYKSGAETYIKPTITGMAGYAPHFIKSLGTADHTLLVGDWVEDDATRYELTTSMANEMGGSQTSNPWTDEWSLVIHCAPDFSNAPATTNATGTTVCGVATMMRAYRSGSLDGPGGAQAAPLVSIVTGNRGVAGLPGGSGAMSWNGETTGGFDLLHVYLKDSKVCVQYNFEYQVVADYTSGSNGYQGNYEGILLSSSTNYAFDGSEPLSITITFNKSKSDDAGGATTAITSNDQFMMFINGQLEDSESLKHDPYYQDFNPLTDSPPLGGLGRTNFDKFVVGSFSTLPAAIAQQAAVTNIVADVGNGSSDFDDRYGDSFSGGENIGFRGTLEEIILYPFEIKNVESSGEYIMDTGGLPDYSGTNPTDRELNYNARLFVYDHTNIRGKSTDEVAASSVAKWKVTGV